jgi:hypothetical protein
LRRPETTIGEAGENLKISRPKSHRNTKQTTGGSRGKMIVIMKIELTGKKNLVTGAAGFIGSNL